MSEKYKLIKYKNKEIALDVRFDETKYYMVNTK